MENALWSIRTISTSHSVLVPELELELCSQTERMTESLQTRFKFKVQKDRVKRYVPSRTTNSSSFILLDFKSIFYKDEKPQQQLENCEDFICNRQSCTPWNLSVCLPVSLSGPLDVFEYLSVVSVEVCSDLGCWNILGVWPLMKSVCIRDRSQDWGRHLQPHTWRSGDLLLVLGRLFRSSNSFWIYVRWGLLSSSLIFSAWFLTKVSLNVVFTCVKIWLDKMLIRSVSKQQT